MDSEIEFGPENGDRIVYVRPVRFNDLPEELQEEAEGVDELYAVHSSDGEQLALVQGRRMAFILAREHDYEPVNVH